LPDTRVQRGVYCRELPPLAPAPAAPFGLVFVEPVEDVPTAESSSARVADELPALLEDAAEPVLIPLVPEPFGRLTAAG
jgi:hypothetical protein